MIGTECDCSEEYGPCEAHSEVLAQRVGSSNRSADELLAVYLDDALAINPDAFTPDDLDVKARVDAALAANGPFDSWLDNDVLADELLDVAHQVESYLGDAVTYWDDGYVIVRITGGPLSNDEVPA